MPIRFDERGLVPVVVQDVDTGAVLMLAYANAEALELSRTTGRAHFYSRSRQELWEKGKTSGQVLQIVEILYDCDQDALLYKVRAPKGACHTGAYSCFGDPGPAAGELGRLWHTIDERIRDGKAESSYTRRLYEAGVDRILRKVGEESGEVIVAAKNGEEREIAAEASDLLYHLFVMLRATDVPLEAVVRELARRRKYLAASGGERNLAEA